MNNYLRLTRAITIAAVVTFPYWARRILTNIEHHIFED